MDQKTFKPLQIRETAAFCNQMAMVLESGISAMEGISIMLEESRDTEEKEMLQVIYDNIVMTGLLQDALEETKAFPQYMLTMVRIGENTGRLDEVMRSLATHYDREDTISRSIRQAVTYPLIMIIMMVCVVVILITKVMPIFDNVFKQLGAEMSGISKGILQAGTMLNRYSVVILIVLAVLIVLGLYFGLSKKGRVQIMELLRHIPAIASYQEQLSICRFASGLSLTLKSGMMQEECLSYARQLVDNETVLKKLDACAEGLLEGQDLAECISKQQVFGGVYARMSSIAARTGAYDDVMQEIADHYQDDVDQKLTGIISALEPTLVIILSLVVGFILLSVMIPLVGIMSSL